MKTNPTRRKPTNGKPVIKKIALKDIRIDKTQSRVRINETTVKEYAELLSDKAKLPPLVVFWDGKYYWLGDGFHRLHAAQSLEIESMECNVHQGTFRDALEHSLGANAGHRLRRTNEDKRKAVEIALADAEWGQLSDRAIAELCGVSNNFVGAVRTSIQVSSDDTAEAAKTGMRIGLDGKLQPAKKAARNATNGATSSEETESESVSAASGAKPSKNGASVVSGRDRQTALRLVGELCRALTTLGFYEMCSGPLSEMLITLKKVT